MIQNCKFTIITIIIIIIIIMIITASLVIYISSYPARPRRITVSYYYINLILLQNRCYQKVLFQKHWALKLIKLTLKNYWRKEKIILNNACAV